MEENVKEKIKKESEKITYELAGEFPTNYLRFLKKLRKAIDISLKSRKRIMIFLSGENQEKIALLTSRLLLFYEEVLREKMIKKEINFLYVFYDTFDDSKLKKEVCKRAVKERGGKLKISIYRIEDSKKLMGQTFQGAVVDLFNDLRPNYVGIITGLIEGGGLLIFQTPSWNSWDDKITLFKKNLIIPGFERPRNIFIKWFKKKIIDHKENIYVYDADNDNLIKDPIISEESIKSEETKIEIQNDVIFPKEIYNLALTQDQVNVIKEAEWLIEQSNKKKMLVITADRGRGKSCALGISIAGLVKALSNTRKVKIVVTSPSIENTQSLMELSIKALSQENLDYKIFKNREELIKSIIGDKFSIVYLEPKDAIYEQADILAIDEASGLPVTLLYKLWQYHKNIIVASTIHGYEGAGRGFSVRFLNFIKNDKDTSLKMIEMNEPIRYAKNDPVENWLFDVLLLDAEPADLDESDIKDVLSNELEYKAYNPEELFYEKEEILRQIFGIYVQAHYRNEPDDLALMADAPHYSIRAVSTKNGKIVSASLLAEEGGLKKEYSKSLLTEDKTRGNIIPDRIVKHYRIYQFGTLKGWRIVRIATHPKIQDKSAGSQLLSFLYKESLSKYDWLGSGFGVNDRLLNFWFKNGFSIIHISPDRNPVSGEYTVLVLKPISKDAIIIQKIITNIFKEKLLNSLYDTYKTMEPELASLMLKSVPLDYEVVRLSELEKQRLWAYLYGTMTYETTNDIIIKVVKNYWERSPVDKNFLDDIEEKALILKVMQGRPWKEVSKELRVSVEKADNIVKNSIRKIAKNYYNITEDMNHEINL
ncbi:MAG: tRNA(Met) cytidine acetyltransferase TmcA [Caldisphaera sp.]